ncbi:MAG: hypothetical protein PVH85_28975 [Desulfobacterales bacterium]|jgi:hypothetical protein
MSTRQVPVWQTLGDALRAPFYLKAASWKTLAKPILALVISSFFPFVVRYFNWGSTVLLIAILPVWAAGAWLAMGFQRHLLLGTAACEPGLRPWHRYGLYCVTLVLVCIFLPVYWTFTWCWCIYQYSPFLTGVWRTTNSFPLQTFQ